MNTDKIRKNIGGALSSFAKSISSVTQSGQTESTVEYPDFLDELMSFFPLDKVDWQAGTYDQYLFDLRKTVVDNYESGNYQVSFFYAHLIFMSYVYYCVERAYQVEPDRMKDIFYPINAYNGREDKPDLESYNSVYDFSKIPEKEIFKVFRIMGMEHQQIKELAKYIGNRDNYAHATGSGNISLDELISSIKAVIGNMTTLNVLFEPSVKKVYIKYLLEGIDKTYEEIAENAYDFIAENVLSLKDIEYISNLGISRVRDENETFKENYRHIRKIHCAFIEYCIENMEITEPENYAMLKDEAYLYYKYHENAAEYVENELGISAYRCGKEGSTFPVYECPDCEAEQLVYNSGTDRYHCFSCDADYTGSELSFCSRCGQIMKANSTSVCTNCIEDMMKD